MQLVGWAEHKHASSITNLFSLLKTWFESREFKEIYVQSN